MSLKNVLIIVDNIDESIDFYEELFGRQCKLICVFGKKWLLFGKNSDMKILIEKEYFYASSKRTNTTDYLR